MIGGKEDWNIDSEEDLNVDGKEESKMINSKLGGSLPIYARIVALGGWERDNGNYQSRYSTIPTNGEARSLDRLLFKPMLSLLKVNFDLSNTPCITRMTYLLYLRSQITYSLPFLLESYETALRRTKEICNKHCS